MLVIAMAATTLKVLTLCAFNFGLDVTGLWSGCC